MTTRLVPLGTNGFIPTYGRHTMSYLVLTDDQATLLDTGTGVARLLEPAIADLVRPYPALHIIYSHFHLDHTVGLSYLTAAWPTKPIHIHTPEQPLLASSGREALQSLIRPPHFPLTLDRFPAPVSIFPVGTETTTVGSLSVRLRAQQHSGGSVGIRLGDEIAYTTDTVVDPATVAFAAGVKVLLHELWLDDAETPPEEATRTGHAYASGVADVATQAGVSRLMIVHHHPRRTMADIRRTAERVQQRTTATVIVPEEGTVYGI